MIKIDDKFDIFEIPKNIEQSNKIKSYNLSNQEIKYFNFTIGQSPFPIPNYISKSLRDHADRNEYSPPLGLKTLNENIARFYKHYHNVSVEPDAIFSGLGTKNVLFLLIGMLEGTYYLPVPAWGGYEPFLKYYKRGVKKINLTPQNQYQFNLDELDNEFLETSGQKVFIFNTPHNPSGKVYSDFEMKELAKLFEKHQVIVISDEIYALTTYDIEKYNSFYNYYPRKTFLLGGISKDRGAAGYRFGVCILPNEKQFDLLKTIKNTISNFYISLPTPIQLAAKDSYSITKELDYYLEQTRKVFEITANTLCEELEKNKKIIFTKPESAFYININLNNYKIQFKNHGINDANQLMDVLFDDPYNVALVPGYTMGLPLTDFTFRIAFVDFDGLKTLNVLANRQLGEIQNELNKQDILTHMKIGIASLNKFLYSLEE